MSQRTFERETRRRKQAEARRATLKRRRAGLAVGAVGAAVLLTPAAANAETFQVNTRADDGPGGSGVCADAAGECTLRDAIAKADRNGEADIITFASDVRGTIYLVTGQLSIGGESNPLTITGPGSGDLTISGKKSGEKGASSNSRIFNIGGNGDARISGLTLTDGNGTANGENSGFGPGGGAIVTDGKLMLSDSVVTANSDRDGFFGNGGGIAVDGGEATITGSEVSHNTVAGFVGSGGGIANGGGTLTVRDSSVTRNEASGVMSLGGGITAIGETTVDGSRVTDNHSTGQESTGGGVSASASDAKFSTNRAAAGQLTITASTISNNDAKVGGGVAADFSSTKFNEAADGVTIARTTIDHNTATQAGGGVAVSNQAKSNDVSVRDTTVSNNEVKTATETDVSTEPSGTGGGLDFANVAGAALISNSTVSGNSAAKGGGIHGGRTTKMIAARRRAARSAEAELPPALAGMAKQQRLEEDPPPPPPATPTGSFVVSNATVAANNASDTGGGVALDSKVTDGNNTKLTSTIVGDNTAGGSHPDLSTSSEADGDGFDLAYSLIEETPGAATAVNSDATKPTITGKDPALGGLTDNGGPTKTMLPATSSPAIDAGDADDSLMADQRVDPRAFRRTVERPPANVGDGTDIGAVELPAPTAASTPPASNPPQPLTPSAMPTTCDRRLISLIDARVKGGKVVLSGLVGSTLYGKKVTIQTDPKGARASGYSKTVTVSASKATGKFTAMVAKPSKDDYVTVRYRAVAGGATSPGLKLPQSLTSKSVKAGKRTITVKGKVKTALLGKRNKVTIRRLACGRYRTVGTARPDAKGNYTVTFPATAIRGVSLYRAEAKVLLRPGSKKYVQQYARAIGIRTTSQTG